MSNPTNEPDTATTQQHKQQPQETNSTHALLKEVLEKAKNGKMYGLEQFPIGTSVQTVLQAWGTPEGGDPGYLDYKIRHQCGLLSANTKSITGITSYHTQLLKLKVDDVKRFLGKPKKQKQEKFSPYKELSYPAGKYQLTFYYQDKWVENVYVGDEIH